jgi:hypothetical protein
LTHRLTKTAAVLLASVVAGAAVWSLATRPSRQVQALQEERRKLIEQRRRLEEYVARLTEHRRVAQVLVTGQQPDAAGRLTTTLTFQEVDEKERSITSQTFTVPSDFVYFDALVIRFDPELIAEDDLKRGHSLALFRRVFGESQPPEEGHPIDPPGAVPARFRGHTQPSELEQELWRNFWLYVREPEQASKMGIRVAQCEAVGAPMRTGDFWILELERDGGLTLIRQPLPSLIQQFLSGRMPSLDDVFTPPVRPAPTNDKPR